MIKPVGHTVLIKYDEAEKMTESGIYIHIDTRLEDASQVIGTVVDYGDQAWKAFSKDFTGEPWVKKGDRVFFARYAGKMIEDPDTEEKYMIMNDEDIRAVITGEDND